MSFRVEMYRGRRRLRQCWRWRAVADNGRILAASGEAYTNRDDVIDVLAKLFGDNGVQIIEL